MRAGGVDGIKANAPQMSVTRGCLRAPSRKTSRRKRCMLHSNVFIVKDRSAAKRYAAEVNAPSRGFAGEWTRRSRSLRVQKVRAPVCEFVARRKARSHSLLRRKSAHRREKLPTRVMTPGERALGVCSGGRVSIGFFYTQKRRKALPRRKTDYRAKRGGYAGCVKGKRTLKFGFKLQP